MNLKESRKVRLAAGVVLITLLSGVGYGMCKWMGSVRPWLVPITLALCGMSLVLLLVYWRAHLREDTEDKVLHFYENPAFWGLCLLLAAGLTFGVVSILHPEPRVVNARVEEILPPPVVEFPTLVVSGVILNGARSSAFVAGRLLHAGEFVEGMRVVRIFEDGVVVEKQGLRQVYYRNTLHGMHLEEGDALPGAVQPTSAELIEPKGGT